MSVRGGSVMAKPTPVEQRSHGEPARRSGYLRRPRKRMLASLGVLALGGRGAVAFQATAAMSDMTTTRAPCDDSVDNAAKVLVRQGRSTFRFDTFGDEKFWGDTLHLNQAIA